MKPLAPPPSPAAALPIGAGRTETTARTERLATIDQPDPTAQRDRPTPPDRSDRQDPPDLRAPPPPTRRLDALVMRRATGVGLVTLLLAALLGLQRAGENIDAEAAAAASLAQVIARLAQLQALDDGAALRELSRLQVQAPLRHLELRIHDGQSRLLLAPPPAEPPAAWRAWLYAGHRALAGHNQHPLAAWSLQRASGAVWRVSLVASPDSERREAIDDLLVMGALLATGIAALLLVMRANVRFALRPLGTLLDAIRGIEAPDHHRAVEAVQALPSTMPVQELEVIAHALRHLAQALDQASAQRRALSRQVLSLQEDERIRLARELHDEFGQRLTALRLDAAWLQRQLAPRAAGEAPPDTEALRAVVDEMAARCAEVQADIRGLLARLRPLGGGAGGAGGAGPEGSTARIAWSELLGQLETLVQAWQASAARGQGPATQFRLVPDASLADAPSSLHPELALTLFRLSQEALTNAARHADAREVRLSLAWEQAPEAHADGLGIGHGDSHGDSRGDGPGWVRWQAQDDGIGIADPSAAQGRGNGLGGMQERVWALGGDWHWSAGAGSAGGAAAGGAAAGAGTAVKGPGAARIGLQLQARLPWR